MAKESCSQRTRFLSSTPPEENFGKKKKKSKLLAFEDWDEFFSSKSGSKDSSQLPLIDEVDVQTGIMIIWWYLPQQSFLVHFFPTLALQAL